MNSWLDHHSLKLIMRTDYCKRCLFVFCVFGIVWRTLNEFQYKLLMIGIYNLKNYQWISTGITYWLLFMYQVQSFIQNEKTRFQGDFLLGLQLIVKCFFSFSIVKTFLMNSSCGKTFGLKTTFRFWWPPSFIKKKILVLVVSLMIWQNISSFTHTS